MTFVRVATRIAEAMHTVAAVAFWGSARRGAVCARGAGFCEGGCVIFYVVYLILVLGALFEVFGGKNISVLGTKVAESKQGMKYSLSSCFFLVAAVYLWFIVAMRSENIGADIKNYVRNFYNIERGINNEYGMELGYQRLNLFFYRFTGSFYLMFFVIALFCCPACYGHIKKHTLFPCFILFLYAQQYFFTTEMAQTRQWIAMSIICLGFNFIKEKSLVKWILLIIFAMQFHISAICALPLYFTTRITVRPWFAWLMLIFTVWVSLLGMALVNLIVDITVSLGFLPKRIAFLLERYIAFEYGRDTGYATGLGYLFNIVCGVYTILLYGFTPKEKRNEMFMLNYCAALFFESMGRNFSEFWRIANYYYICGLGFNVYTLIIQKNRLFKGARWFQAICTLLFLGCRVCITCVTMSRPTSILQACIPYETFLFD